MTSAVFGSKPLPDGWFVSGDGGDIVVEQQSPLVLRMRKHAASRFTGVNKVADATPFAGKIIRVRARLRAEDVAAEKLRVFARADAEKSADRGFISRAVDVRERQWVVHDTFLLVEEGARRLMYGVTLEGAGEAWVQDVEVTEATDPPVASAEAERIVDEAIAKIRNVAYYASRVDWEKARQRALVLVPSPAPPDAALRYLLSRLEDNHSFFMPKEQVQASRANQRTDDFEVRGEAIGSAGLIRIPGFMQSHAARESAFVWAIRDQIASLEAHARCGWIVDLRGDTGGNMYPMLGGLAPLLGSGTLGFHVGKERRQPWSVPPAWRLESPLLDAPVAVLTGPGTTSSGEAVTISFRGRPHTRSFGTATNGRSTGNVNVPLSDGSMLLVMSVMLADREGTAYGGPIPPDELIAQPDRPMPTAEDPVVLAALEWLERGRACSR